MIFRRNLMSKKKKSTEKCRVRKTQRRKPAKVWNNSNNLVARSFKEISEKKESEVCKIVAADEIAATSGLVAADKEVVATDSLVADFCQDKKKKEKANKGTTFTCKTKRFNKIGAPCGAMVKKYSGKRFWLMALAAMLAVIVATSGVMLSLGSNNRAIVIPTPDQNTTVRKQVPADGSLPTEHKPIDNLAYMAYVLDLQTSYHAYALNSTKSTGYEQITQTWKDYKVTDIDGVLRKVMVCSDLSYSALVKSATQSCFVDGSAAYMRTGDKPEKNSTPTDIVWSSSTPKKYSKSEYLTTYGEFSTELSVYVINKGTIESALETVDNKDGTYSQTFVLNSGAACWYQYGMKTRGGLRSSPEYEKIEITFTFDKDWRVLSTYCEEKAKIAPAAFGGISMGSTSKTTTTFEYGENTFDNAHFNYCATYYKEYFDKQIDSTPSQDDGEVSLTDVLMGGFGKVISGEGQQFNLSLTLGEQNYDGKVYIKLASLEDVVNSLDVRLALEKRGSGKQDLYAEFKQGNINVYYSNSFALTADINKVANSITSLNKAIENLLGKTQDEDIAPQAESGGINLADLLNALKVEVVENDVKISLDSDNLLGLGVGVGLELNFNRTKADGTDTYLFRNLKVNELALKGESIKLNCEIIPDGGEIISHNPSQSTANLADYIDGISELLQSKSYFVNFSLDGSCQSISQISGLKLQGEAQVELLESLQGVKVNLPLSVDYNGITATLNVYYTYDFNKDNYGKIYIHLTEVCRKQVNAKISCDIKELIKEVKELIAGYMPASSQSDENSTAPSENSGNELNVAKIVNSVISLDFGSIVKELNGNESGITVSIDGDKVLKTVLDVLNKQFDIELGTATLRLNLDGGKINISGSVSALGLDIGICGSSESVPPINESEYANANSYLKGIRELLNSNAYAVTLSLDAPSEIPYLYCVSANGIAYIQPDKDFKRVDVSIPNLTIDYKGLTAVLSLYYKVDFVNGGYGDIYVTLVRLGGKQVNVKVYADIQNTTDAVTALINTFKQPSQNSEEPCAAVYADVVSIISSFDFGEIITQLNVNSQKFEVGLNVDELLKSLKVNMPFALGNVELNLGLESGKGVLFGTLPKFNLTAKVEGCSDTLTAPDAADYANIETYINAVKTLLENNTYSVNLSLDGTSSIEYLKDVTANCAAVVKIDKSFKNIIVHVPSLEVTYKTLSAVLSLDYSINLNSGNYGKVYATLKNIGGKEVNVNIYCDIKEVKTSIEKLISSFKPSTGNTATAGQTSNVAASSTANIVEQLLKIDFEKLINSLTADNTGINLSLNADELLKSFNVNLNNIAIGEATLKVALDENNEISADCKLVSHGLTLSLKGSLDDLPTLDESKYIDVVSYVDGINDILNANSIEVTLNYTGTDYSSLSLNLDGLTLSTTAQVKFTNNFKTIQVNAPILVNYKNYSAVLEVYYAVQVDDKNFGSAYITLKELNGAALSAKVKADITQTVKSVKELMELVTPSTTKTPSGEESKKFALSTAELVDKLVGLDFAKILCEFTANGSGINLALNTDELLKALNLTVENLTLGGANLGVTLQDNALMLSASLPKSGVEKLVIKRSDKVVAGVDESLYIDAIDFVNLAKELIKEGQKIQDSKQVAFDIEKFDLTIDGISILITGNGQVGWLNGVKRVALNLVLEICEGDRKESVAIKLVYDEDIFAPHLVRFTVNNLGLVIDKKDKDDLSSGIKNILATLNSLFNSDKKQEPVAPSASTTLSTNILEQIDGDLITRITDILLSYVSNLTMNFENSSEGSVKNLVVSYLNNANLTVCANGGIKASLTIKNNDGAQILNLVASAHAPDAGEDVFATLNSEFDSSGAYTFYSSSESKQFTLAVYEYMFALLDNLTVKNLLGSNTYTVDITIDGNASKIESLKGIGLDANVYYTETAEGKKLIEININNLTVNSTVVVASVVYYDNYLYIALRKVGDRNLYQTYTDELNNTPITVKASKGEIYKAVDTLIKLITGDKLKSIIPLFKQGSTAVSANELAQNANINSSTPTEKSVDINRLISALLEVSCSLEKVDGKNTLKANIDNALSLFGIELGDIVVSVDPKTHEVNAILSKDNLTWASLNASAVENSVHGVAPVKENYIDIDFIATLLEDIEKTTNSLGDRVITENGVEKTKPDLRVSLTGNIRIDVSYSVISTNVRIDNSVVTLGLDENDKFYFTLKGDLQKSSYLMYTVARAMPISVTYSNGYMTMCRTDGNGNKIYKVMTIEYLIDNLLDKNKSPVRWLLGTSDTPWGLICDNVKLPINSGLTQKQYIYLYNNSVIDGATQQDLKMFNLASLLLGLNVKYDDYTSTFGNYQNAISKFSDLTNNYYAFDIDLRQFIGNAISSLNCVLVRNAEGGIKGVNAFAALDGNYLTLNARLDGGLITAESENRKHAEDTFKTVNSIKNIDFNIYANAENKKFGCYSSEDEWYDYSEYNKLYSLKVYSFEEGTNLNAYPVNVRGNVLTHDKSYRSGSTVYAFAEEQWLDSEHIRKLIYVDENGNDIGNSFVLTSDTIIYLMITGKNVVRFYDENHLPCNVDENGNEIYLYAGDKLPAPLSISIEKNGATYLFAGWYTDENCTTTVTSVQTDINDYYAKFVPETVLESNGIQYKFVYDENVQNSGYYIVWYFNSAFVTDGVDYSNANNILVIANTINGYKVTQIADYSLAYRNNDNYYLKHIVVPENVTVVKPKAFRDNRGMLSVTFLAPKVEFYGNSGHNKDFDQITTPFLGCTDASSNIDHTDLVVYYNQIVEVDNNYGGKDGNPAWALFHWKADNKPRFIGNDGGARVNSGSAYVTYTVNGDFTKAQLELTDYITTSTEYSGILANSLIEKINTYTARQGYVYGYAVEISGEYKFNSIVNLTVNVTKCSAYYAFALDKNSTVNSATYTVNESNKVVYQNVEYIKEGATVTLMPQPAQSYVFKNWQINGNATSENEFAMPNATTTATANWDADWTQNVYVSSKIAFAYEGVEYAAGNKVRLTNAVNGLTLSDVTNSDYTFLGWANVNGDTLTTYTDAITLSDAAETIYTALWTQNKNGVTYTYDKATNTLSALADPAVGTFYGWYDGQDSAFAGMLISQNANLTLIPSTTCLTARLQFTLTVFFDGENSGLYQTANKDLSYTNDGNNANLKNGVFTEVILTDKSIQKYLRYVVLEGELLNLFINASEPYKMTMSVSNEFSILYEVSKTKKKYLWSSLEPDWRHAERRFNDKDSHFIEVNNQLIPKGTGEIFKNGVISSNTLIHVKI